MQTALAAMQLGVCDRALRMTASYTSMREQFGRKIATFQAVGQRAANAYIDVECLRLVVQHAAWLLGEERPASEEVSVAKIWAGDTGHRVSFAAQHLHGGMGVDVDYPLHRYCLWAKQLELTLGSSTEEIERLGAAIAARLVLASERDPQRRETPERPIATARAERRSRAEDRARELDLEAVALLDRELEIELVADVPVSAVEDGFDVASSRSSSARWIRR